MTDALEDLGVGGAVPDDEIEMLPGVFPLTDLGNAERMCARFRGLFRWCEQKQKWLVWNGHEWEWDKRRRVDRMAKATARGIHKEAIGCDDPDKRKAISKHALKSEARAQVKAMVELAKAEPGVAVLVEELDTDPWLLNCANGTLDLRTGALREARREDLITKSTGVAYRERASSVLWERTLEAGTGGDRELAAYMQRVAGYALTGLATERKFFFLFGKPGTGKSTLIEAFHAGMGSYARTTSFETWLRRPNIGGNRDDLVALQGVRLVTSGECAKDARWDSPLVKQITGGDRISAMAKFESTVEFVASCTILLAANDSPRVGNDDAGFWERMQRIPFSQVVPVEARVKGLHAKLREPEHAEAILAWAVEGCAEWQRSGIGSCPVVEESTRDYRAENDWLADFLDGFTFGPEQEMAAPRFRDLYERYCKQEGQKAMSTKSLAEEIGKRGIGVRFEKRSGFRYWSGIGEPSRGFSWNTAEA